MATSHIPEPWEIEIQRSKSQAVREICIPPVVISAYRLQGKCVCGGVGGWECLTKKPLVRHHQCNHRGCLWEPVHSEAGQFLKAIVFQAEKPDQYRLHYASNLQLHSSYVKIFGAAHCKAITESSLKCIFHCSLPSNSCKRNPFCILKAL